MCKVVEELKHVKEDLTISNRICEELSKKSSYGIWKADSENNIYFMNDTFKDMVNSPKNLSDIFTTDEILLFQHNDRLEFNYTFRNKAYKVIFEKSPSGHSFGLVRQIDQDDILVNNLLILKKEFRQILEEW